MLYTLLVSFTLSTCFVRDLSTTFIIGDILDESLFSIPITEKPSTTRRFRTHFSRGQLRVLRDTFEKTRYPNWFIVNQLSSSIHLDESIIKTWFKNQRVKWRKQEQQTGENLSLEDLQQVSSVEEEEASSPATSANSRPTGLSISDASDHEPPKSGIEQPQAAGATPCSSSCGLLPDDLQQINFRDFDLPWASTPYDMDQFIQLYALPGGDGPWSLDQDLFPECSD
uniref:Paired-like homeodomain transcription factor LEUTX n=1 Tax=Camelus bactrianus TaxID=9837 RepID=A0A9W3FUA6_CAMBA|nr:paired-like homeodomain transcription factor LEUTX [Camelus bactrianus]